MIAMNSTQVRNEWSAVVDSVVRNKPRFIKRTRDYLLLTDIDVLETMLSVYTFRAEVYNEDDGSVTMALNDLDLVENGRDKDEVLSKLASAILEYAEDFYNDFSYWARGDRKRHIPYVIKALMINNAEKIGGLIECRHGEI